MVNNDYSYFGKSIKGFTHKITNTECQDAYFYKQYKESRVMAIADGHGSMPLSKNGAEFAVKITCDICEDFIKAFDENKNYILFDDLPNDIYCGINSYKVDTSSGFELERIVTIKNDGYYNVNVLEKHKVSLFFKYIYQIEKCIVSLWNDTVLEDFKSLNYNKKEELNKLVENNKLPSIGCLYGTTLLATVLTPNYWFAFQIGDGKCVAFLDKDINYSSKCLPIPWDNRCKGNVTTSICDFDALNEFRHCVGIRKPVAVFLGTDGIEMACCNDKNNKRLIDFYFDLMHKLFYLDEKENFEKEIDCLSDDLCIDDVTISCFVDKNNLKASLVKG